MFAAIALCGAYGCVPEFRLLARNETGGDVTLAYGGETRLLRSGQQRDLADLWAGSSVVRRAVPAYVDVTAADGVCRRYLFPSDFLRDEWRRRSAFVVLHPDHFARAAEGSDGLVSPPAAISSTQPPGFPISPLSCAETADN